MHGSADAIIAALKQSLRAGEELPLLRVGKNLGLFLDPEPAQTALRQGYFETARTEMKGKAQIDWVRPTARGLEFLRQSESPKSVLEEVRGLLELNAAGAPLWAAELKAQLHALSHRLELFLAKQEDGLTQLRERVEAACRRIDGDPAAPPADLEPWQLDLFPLLRSHPGPAPFSRLYVPLTKHHPTLTLAAFHAGLLSLQARRLLELVAATGPLAELPEPEFALLDGSELYIAARLA